MIKHCPITIPSFGRGVHLITGHILDGVTLPQEDGLLTISVQHTSCALSINENADPLVRDDLNRFLDHLVPESWPHYKHVDEGPDDMPAHIKSVLCGPSITIPTSKGVPLLGTWQGVYLLEFRNAPREIKIIATLQT